MKKQNLQEDISQLAAVLEDKDFSSINAVIGVDGFVDEIIHVVDTRETVEDYTRLKTINSFGERILKAAGLSTNIELVPVQVKLGGNGPILANALVEYGNNVTYVGALGNPSIHPVFRDMADRCTEIISVANPGHTDAVEFEDGKLMLGKLESLKDINWDNIKKQIDIEEMAELLDSTDLLGLENWTMVPFMNGIWEGLIEEVFPLMKDGEKRRIAFFDLADPEKRTNEAIKEALNILERFSPQFNVILGLNKKEAIEIAEVLGIKVKNLATGDVDLEELTTKVAEELDIYCLVVHPVDRASAYCDGEYFETVGPYTPNPKLTTGAGDNFNAGFCLAQSLGLPVQLSLVMGTATSGFYVRNAKSPTKEGILEFLDSWSSETA
ncbi:MAG: hypothetical protein ACLFPF_03485 [Halanaerobiales bacterium]